MYALSQPDLSRQRVVGASKNDENAPMEALAPMQKPIQADRAARTLPVADWHSGHRSSTAPTRGSTRVRGGMTGRLQRGEAGR
ncbi:hypothetical protein C7H84_16225 [Burkholderia sp. Nafp2/4-1b]|uniref:hypothetical protein n=1 Tax=Burkholderia sp. Nafp2/4-1b TaxID=2116686 RepID=UPI000F149CA0|nr:hypothetical protein [Burkholderia sp. Nafp2/4-1b]RKU02127.1 hypothetical protein C7H84_16225 [Burkholderia sp. Nafp2/4-1b]